MRDEITLFAEFLRKMTNALTAISKPPNRDQLIAAGEMIELRFKDGHRALSLRSAKLLHILANHAGADAAKDIEHKILISELNFSHIELEELTECARELMTIIVELTYFDEQEGELRIESGPLLARVDRPVKIGKPSNILRFKFSHTVQKIIISSEKWASLSRDIIISFNSRYALRLYEIISLRINMKYKSSEEFEIYDLKKRLGVEKNKLKEFSHFRQTALEPAIDEVNKISGFNVSYETSKTGRSTSHITLHWTPKPMPERAQIAADLASLPLHEEDAPSSAPAKRPEPQDKPRRAACQPFPPQGGLSYGQNVAFWRELAETHVKRLQGGHIPDLNTLAATFRAWCAENYIPLDLPTIDKTFMGFCRKYVPDDL